MGEERIRVEEQCTPIGGDTHYLPTNLSVEHSDIEAVVLDVLGRWISRVQGYYTEGVGEEALYGGPSCLAHMGREIAEMEIPSTGTDCPADRNSDDPLRDPMSGVLGTVCAAVDTLLGCLNRTPCHTPRQPESCPVCNYVPHMRSVLHEAGWNLVDGAFEGDVTPPKDPLREAVRELVDSIEIYRNRRLVIPEETAMYRAFLKVRALLGEA